MKWNVGGGIPLDVSSELRKSRESKTLVGAF